MSAHLGQLTKIASCDLYKVDALTHSIPYLTPVANTLLTDIGTRFQQQLREQGYRPHRIIVTSVLRSADDVKRLQNTNSNAIANSPHRYGTTFDITYIRYDRLSRNGKPVNNNKMADILGSVLSQLRKERRCYVKYERKQHCFHITVRK
ncbi:MAG: DUF5715 family protein [Prevotella sp.]|nr:DUF5715 family protein [Prevotella sp.]